MITTRMTERAAGIAAVAVLFMGTIAAVVGGVLSSPFGDQHEQSTITWRHDGAAVVAIASSDVRDAEVASEGPVPTVAGATVIERAAMACAGRDDDEATQSALDLATASSAAGVTEDELCARVAMVTAPGQRYEPTMTGVGG